VWINLDFSEHGLNDQGRQVAGFKLFELTTDFANRRA
jgi:hypothetical protein